ncbi:MAG: ribonucleotide reductase N-terminal alpha domain-containing protein [Rudaea sp.]
MIFLKFTSPTACILRRQKGNAVLDNQNNSPFVDPAAVEAWDAWFRLRAGNNVLELSIEATWLRIARALAGAEPRNAEAWEQRFFDALSSWQLLLDERIIAGARAGTNDCFHPDSVALLNAAAFVGDPFAADASFDFAGFHKGAKLAVRALDNVVLRWVSGQRASAAVRIGIIGVADALTLLGLRYDSAEGRAFAGRIARIFAEGCLAGNAGMARERGARFGYGGTIAELTKFPGISAELIAQASTFGLRHASLTAIVSRPKLALLANNVADALDPLNAGTRLQTIEANAISRTIRSHGYAAMLALHDPGAKAQELVAENTIDSTTMSAQIEIRGAMQPWIDSRIDYPFSTSGRFDTDSIERWKGLAVQRQLGQLRGFRRARSAT